MHTKHFVKRIDPILHVWELDNEYSMGKDLMCLHIARLETDPVLAPVVSQSIPVGYLSD